MPHWLVRGSAASIAPSSLETGLSIAGNARIEPTRPANHARSSEACGFLTEFRLPEQFGQE